jgi:hypothetical protein
VSIQSYSVPETKGPNPTDIKETMNLNINSGVLDTPEAEAYFTKADHRILCGCRATLEMLGIPLPEWAKRKPTGPKPGQRIAAAYRQDNPETLHQATMRKSADHAARLPDKPDNSDPLNFLR